MPTRTAPACRSAAVSGASAAAVTASGTRDPAVVSDATLIDQVFQGDRDTMQGAAPLAACNQRIGRARRRQRFIAGSRDERIQLAVQARDLRKATLRQCERGQLAAPNPIRRGADVERVRLDRA